MKKSKSKAVFKSCPHFLKAMKTCSLSNEGFYLPSPKNLSKYCLAPTYKKCSIYKEKYTMEKDKIKSEIEDHNSRRNFRRIPTQRKVLIRTCDPLGFEVGDFAELALTVDYSQNGMRIISSKEIPAEALLLFNFDYDFLIPQLEGFAQLCWQKKFKSLPQGIEAGLIFKDDDSRKALSHKIENIDA
jgi:hypothetical protein